VAVQSGLIFLSTRLEGTSKRGSFHAAWIFFAPIPLWQLIMHLFRAGDIRSSRTLQLIEIWDQAVPCLLLGVSLLCLSGALASGTRESR
jgi:hypothetical protein